MLLAQKYTMEGKYICEMKLHTVYSSKEKIKNADIISS